MPDDAKPARQQQVMAKTDFQSVDEYLAAQPEAARDVLRRVGAPDRQVARPRKRARQE
jgi:hypothetical protein